MIDNLPYSQACENNKEPIASVLASVFDQPHRVIEIGSGTAQHAVFFANAFKHIFWQISDLDSLSDGAMSRVRQSGLTNIGDNLTLDVEQAIWPVTPGEFDTLFTANTLHIMSWQSVIKLIETAGKILAPKALFCIYGPFKYQQSFTSVSNAEFDHWLKSRDSRSGIRDFEALNALSEQAGFTLLNDHPMPANNQLLLFGRNA